MNEEEIFEILNSYKEAIDLILKRLDEMDEMYHQADDRAHKLESVIYDEILEPTRLAMEHEEREGRFNEFNDKFGEKLGAYDKILGAAEGNPDFSMVREAFDKYDELEEPKPESEAFVDGLIETVEAQIDGIKESLGIAPDTETVITQDEDGNTTVEVDGEVVAEESETTEEKDGPAEPAEDAQNELPFDEENSEEDDPDEIAKFEKELEELSK